MNPAGVLADLAAQTLALLRSLEAPVLAPFLADWPAGSGHSTDAAPVPAARLPGARGPAARLPVLRCLPEITAVPAAFAQPVLGALRRSALELDWRQTYSTADIDAEFLRNYGWAELLGPAGPVQSLRLLGGFLILGPHTSYPLHAHEAEEIYVPLHGTADWLQGDDVWRQRPPGTVVHHRSGEPHAMRTVDRPLLACYLWRSRNLRQKASFIPTLPRNPA